jgi:hypothetical protein
MAMDYTEAGAMQRTAEETGRTLGVARDKSISSLHSMYLLPLTRCLIFGVHSITSGPSPRFWVRCPFILDRDPRGIGDTIPPAIA